MNKVLCLYIVAGIFIFYIMKYNNIQLNLIKYILMESIIFILLNIFKVDYKYYVVVLIMIGIIICDLKYYIIPDSFHLLLLINRIMFINSIDELYNSIFNILILVIIISIVAIILKYLLHKDTIGGGDIKLLFSLGIYCSYMVNIYCLMIACISALFYMFVYKKRMIAFGPFICMGYLLYFISLYNNI